MNNKDNVTNEKGTNQSNENLNIKLEDQHKVGSNDKIEEKNNIYSNNTKKVINNYDNSQMNIFDKNDRPSKNKIMNINKGDLLEYRLKRLIFSMGYYPKIGVLLKTSQEEISDMITDLDVYGFYVHKNFSSRTIWADCKSGQAKALERISWIIGVKQLSKIDEVIFVKKGIRSSTREFARNSGIQILDLEILEKLEKDFSIEESDWRGSWNPHTQINQLVTFQKINIPNMTTYKKIGNFISSGYWTCNDYTKVKKCITALKQLSEIEQFPLTKEQKTSVHWVTFELVNLLVLATLNISKELYYFSDKDKKETITNKLVSGGVSSQMRSDLVNATYKIAHSIILQEIPNYNKKLEIPKLDIEPPIYSEAYLDLVLRITNNPLQYFDVLRFLDFMFMEFDLQSKKVDSTVMKEIFLNYEDLIISAKTIIHFICSVTGIRRDLFQLFS